MTEIRIPVREDRGPPAGAGFHAASWNFVECVGNAPARAAVFIVAGALLLLGRRRVRRAGTLERLQARRARAVRRRRASNRIDRAVRGVPWCAGFGRNLSAAVPMVKSMTMRSADIGTVAVSRDPVDPLEPIHNGGEIMARWLPAVILNAVLWFAIVVVLRALDTDLFTLRGLAVYALVPATVGAFALITTDRMATPHWSPRILDLNARKRQGSSELDRVRRRRAGLELTAWKPDADVTIH